MSDRPNISPMGVKRGKIQRYKIPSLSRNHKRFGPNSESGKIRNVDGVLAQVEAHTTKEKVTRPKRSTIKLRLVPYSSSSEENSSDKSPNDVAIPKADSEPSRSQTEPRNEKPAYRVDNNRDRLHDQASTMRTSQIIRHQRKAKEEAQTNDIGSSERGKKEPRRDQKEVAQQPTANPSAPRKLIRFVKRLRPSIDMSGQSLSADSAQRKSSDSSKNDTATSESQEESSSENLTKTYGIESAPNDSKRHASLNRLLDLFILSAHTEDYARGLKKHCGNEDYEVIIAPKRLFTEIKPHVSPETLIDIFSKSDDVDEYEERVKNVHYGKDYIIAMKDWEYYPATSVSLRGRIRRGTEKSLASSASQDDGLRKSQRKA